MISFARVRLLVVGKRMACLTYVAFLATSPLVAQVIKPRKTLPGHTESVKSVAFSPDSKILASGSEDDDGTVKLWDVATGNNIATLKGHSSVVNSVAFSPNGKTVASASRETIKLWDVRTGKNTATIEWPGSFFIESIAFSPDGKTLASGAYGEFTGHPIKLWDVATGKNIATLEGESLAIVFSVAFSPDGRTIASAVGNGNIVGTSIIDLWDVSTGKNVAILNGHKGDVQTIAFSPDGKTLASGSDDDTVKLWDVATRKNTATLKRELSVTSVAFSPDGKTLAVGGLDGMTLWDIANKKIVRITTNDVNSVAFSPDGKTLASASRYPGDKTVRLWDVKELSKALSVFQAKWHRGKVGDGLLQTHYHEGKEEDR